MREWSPAADRLTLRATLDTLPGGYHLLVGREIDDLDELTNTIETALLRGRRFAILHCCGGRHCRYAAHRWGGSKLITALTSRAINAKRPRGADTPARNTGTSGDQLAGNLNSDARPGRGVDG